MRSFRAPRGRRRKIPVAPVVHDPNKPRRLPARAGKCRSLDDAEKAAWVAANSHLLEPI